MPMTGRDEGASWLLALMGRRRVCRSFTDEPVDVKDLRALAGAARAAPSASNQRINKFLVVTDRARIRLLRQVAPGMLGEPTALIVILTDTEKAAAVGVKLDRDPRTRWADVGAAAENILLAAEALGLGACPLMSFSVEGARSVLALPDHLIPDYAIQLGHRTPGAGVPVNAPRPAAPAVDPTFWEHVS
jgi:nitroreductase